MSYTRTPWGRIFLGVLLLAIAVPAIWLYPRYRIANAFPADELRRYEDTLTDGNKPRPGDALPRRRGRVVLMVASKRRPGGRFVVSSLGITPEIRKRTEEVEPPRLHDAMFDLDSSVRAHSPEEVGTVIFCEDYTTKVVDHKRWEDENYEYHMSFEKGRRNGVFIFVYDLASGQLLGAYDVEGPRPRLEAGGYGRPDPVDLAGTIENLPFE